MLQSDGKQLAALLQRLASLQVRPHSQWLQEALHIIQSQLDAFGPPHLSSSLGALAKWRHQPGDHWMAAFQQRVLTLINEDGLTTRELSDLVWGLAQLGQPPQPLFTALLHLAGSKFDVCSTSSLSDLIWAVANAQHSPGQEWLVRFAESTQQRLHAFTPHELSKCVWALARLRCHPGEEWISKFYEASAQQFRSFDSKGLSLTIWALATLGCQPTDAWLRAFEHQAEGTLKYFQAAELTCILWALSQLRRQQPHELQLGHLLRKQDTFLDLDYQLLANPKLLRFVRAQVVGPAGNRGTGA